MTKTVCYLFFLLSRRIYELETGLSKSGTTHYDSPYRSFILFLDVGHMFAG